MALFHPACWLIFEILPTCTFIPTCTSIWKTKVVLYKLIKIFIKKPCQIILGNTWRYPLHGYILGLLLHTTAWTNSGKVMKLWVKFQYTYLGFTLPNIIKYVPKYHIRLWIQGVWGWLRLHIFYSFHIWSTFHRWYYVIRLQE